ncbi:MFS transporter [Variovorax sp. PBL-E5]|uniref:MFS transporter n=1 Tax=Variovorax sp. PBL-E5 TaxID=434014 RepID=UPI0013194809|nr:MFS transporter [Variovorax sp. PBL-E5]VTU27278.1 Sulfonamide resistance protein [Variovorax sp. PBL-E5]
MSRPAVPKANTEALLREGTPVNRARPGGLAALATVHFCSSAMMRACDPMLPSLAQTFGVTAGRAALTVSVYAVAYGLLQLLFGPLGDRYGKRRTIGFAALGCVLGNVLAMFAASLEMLVLARFLAGAAAAGIIALVLAWVGDTVPYDERQPVLARFLMLSLGGMIAGQWVSAVFTEWLGWRAVFALLAGVFCIGGLAISLNREVRTEAVRAPSPHGHVRDIVRVLSEPWARWMLLVVAAEGAFAFSGLAFLPAYLVREFGLALSAAAGVVVLYGIGGFFYAFAARRLLARLGESGMVFTGGIALGIGWLVLAVGRHWALALPACLVAGVGFYMLHGTLQTLATQMVPALRGTAVSLFASTMFLGIAAGVAGASAVVDRIGARPVFMVCAAALLAIGAALALSLRQRAAATRLRPTS